MPADEAAPPEVISAVNEPVDEAAALVEAQAIIEQVLSQTHAEVEVEVESPSTATSEANLSAVDGVDHQDGEDQVLSQQEVKDLENELAQAKAQVLRGERALAMAAADEESELAATAEAEEEAAIEAEARAAAEMEAAAAEATLKAEAEALARAKELERGGVHVILRRVTVVHCPSCGRTHRLDDPASQHRKCPGGS